MRTANKNPLINLVNDFSEKISNQENQIEKLITNLEEFNLKCEKGGDETPKEKEIQEITTQMKGMTDLLSGIRATQERAFELCRYSSFISNLSNIISFRSPAFSKLDYSIIIALANLFLKLNSQIETLETERDKTLTIILAQEVLSIIPWLNEHYNECHPLITKLITALLELTDDRSSLVNGLSLKSNREKSVEKIKNKLSQFSTEETDKVRGEFSSEPDQISFIKRMQTASKERYNAFSLTLLSALEEYQTRSPDRSHLLIFQTLITISSQLRLNSDKFSIIREVILIQEIIKAMRFIENERMGYMMDYDSLALRNLSSAVAEELKLDIKLFPIGFQGRFFSRSNQYEIAIGKIEKHLKKYSEERINKERALFTPELICFEHVLQTLKLESSKVTLK